MKSGTRQSRGLNYKGFAEAKPASGRGEVNENEETAMSGRGPVEQEPEFVAWVGIDWADQKHVWCLQARIRRDGKMENWSTSRKWWRPGLVNCANASGMVRSQWPWSR